ncbi:MAG: hypothetical protein IJU31_05915 [Synergistaceae bacterium]|nr:hypothetical protein [Synergistaceae bacterium]
MVITRENNDKWIISSSSTKITINISSWTTPKINIEMSGSGSNSTLGNYSYNLICSLTKTSSTASTDEESEDSSSTDTTIADTLEGTWKLTKETEATATSTTLGSDKELTLKLASDVYLIISNINLAPDNNTTSQTGTATVVYSQKWTAYDSDEIQQGSTGAFTFSKNETMKIAREEDGVWRIEDTTNSNEHIDVTIASSSEITTVWQGTTTTLDNSSYYYEITCSFRKQ